MDLLKFDRNRKTSKLCPCGRNNRDGKFVPFKGYIDKGHCHSCGETFFPKREEKTDRTFFSPMEKEQTKAISYLPFDILEKSVMAHERCDLFPFLEKLFRKPLAKWLCENYFIGSNKAGKTVFWQVDKNGNVRQAKVMKYDSVSGRRDKSTGAFFAGKTILCNDNANLQQCFFGEYLINDNANPIAVCESEKTATLASIFFPHFVWIATGGKNGISFTERHIAKVLNGKKVILFPDANAYDSWNNKAQLLSRVACCRVVVSDVVERFATVEEKQLGLDIADYLLRNQDETGLALTDFNYPVMWDYLIGEKKIIPVTGIIPTKQYIEL